MLAKLKAAGALALAAIARPGMALYALRERGLAHVWRRFVSSDAGSIGAMARDLRFRSMPPTQENLQSYYRDVVFEPCALAGRYLVRLPGGERFYIRTARGWSDLGTLYDTFVVQIYRYHPDVDGKTVIDVGANIGDTAVYFAQQGARVIAYEPDPQMCALGRDNAELNGLQVEFHDAGVGGATQQLRLSATPEGADSMSVTLFPGESPLNRMHTATVPVRIVALQDVLAPLDSVALLKMDCEGCEYSALRSTAPAALRKIGHIIMEYHARGDELIELLRAAGFVVHVEGSMYLYADRGP
ncbi:MAG: FkbM family methyltransferase [Candidatus Eremiobacteraeota bacterium]|nr:FkbM family methyltransferase [Candidatus Eremiobacteraeota bacterium]